MQIDAHMQIIAVWPKGQLPWKDTMSRSSGFVPINFRLGGKLLLAAGVLGLLFTGLAALTKLRAMPPLIIYASLAAIPLGLYMIFVVPREDQDTSAN